MNFVELRKGLVWLHKLHSSPILGGSLIVCCDTRNINIIDMALGYETRCFSSIFDVLEDQTTVKRIITIHRTYLYYWCRRDERNFNLVTC